MEDGKTRDGRTFIIPRSNNPNRPCLPIMFTLLLGTLGLHAAKKHRGGILQYRRTYVFPYLAHIDLTRYLMIMPRMYACMDGYTYLTTTDVSIIRHIKIAVQKR